MKRKTIIVAFVLCVVFILTSCSLIDSIFDPLPDKYVDGLKVPKDLPDEIELYDDAIVYDADEDDESVELSYGVSVDLDEIIDFYEDLFDEEEIEVIESDDSDDEFYVNGKGEGFIFELEAEIPTSGYKERAFDTIVTIEVTFTLTAAVNSTPEPEDTPESTVESTDEIGSETLTKMSGLWILSGIDGDIADTYKADGVAVYISGNSITGYSSFEIDLTETLIAFDDNDTISYKVDEELRIVDIGFEVIGGMEFMTWTKDEKTGYFSKTSYDAFMAYNVPVVDTDSDSEDGLTDPNFTLGQIEYDGVIIRAVKVNVYYQLGEWTPETDGDIFLTVEWEVDNGSDATIATTDLPYMWLEDEEFYYETDVELSEAYALLEGINLDNFYRDMETGSVETNCDVFIIQGDLLNTAKFMLTFSTNDGIISLN